MAAEITRNPHLVEMTAGQLADLLQNAGQLTASTPATTPVPGRRYVYGLKGIMQLFGVSNVTAQRYKAGIIKEAVTQYGRKIVVDADKALALFKAAQDQQ